MFAKKTYAALTMAASAALLVGCQTYGMDDGEMASASADTTVMVGGAAMYPSRNIVENAVNSADHTTLVAAVKAAGPVLPLRLNRRKPTPYIKPSWSNCPRWVFRFKRASSRP